MSFSSDFYFELRRWVQFVADREETREENAVRELFEVEEEARSAELQNS